MRKLLTILSFLVPLLSLAQGVVIPLTASDFYANDRIAPITPLFDGDLTISSNYVPCYSKHVDTLQIVYDFPVGQHVTVRQIKIYDGQGSNTVPSQYLLRDLATGIIHQVGTFDGSQYGAWVTLTVTTPVENSQLIIKGQSGANYGVEMQIVGDYNTTYVRPLTFAPRTMWPFKYMLGANSYWWDYQQDMYNNPGDATHVIARKFARISGSFRLVRFFSDWVQWEPHQGQYALSPLRDGWMPDSVLKRNHDAGIETDLCIQSIPTYMKASYVTPNYGDSTDWGPFHDRVPVMKANYTRREDPASYNELRKLAWQITARYGRNAAIDTTLITLWNEAADGKGYYLPQTRKVGLNYVHYFCLWNEDDKYWKGDSAYLWGRAMAAAYSAVWDGDHGRLGPGVRDADSTMNLVFAAFSVASVDQLRGAIDWVADNRGYRADGTLDVPWKVIDYHKYSTDNPDQYGNNHTGVAPELGDAFTAARSFVYASNRYLNGMPVWISEHGYDTSQTSPFKAHAIGSMDKLVVQGAWLIRSSLAYAALGLQGATVFQLFDDSQNPAAFSTQFETSGLLDQDSLFSPRPAVNFYMQALNLMGDYTYASTVVNTAQSIWVDKYVKSGSNDKYALRVPDSVDRHTTYNLVVPQGSTVTVSQLMPYQSTPTVSTLYASTGVVALDVKEIPMIVEVAPGTVGQYHPHVKQSLNLKR